MAIFESLKIIIQYFLKTILKKIIFNNLFLCSWWDILQLKQKLIIAL